MIRNVLTARVGNLICQVYVNLRPSALSLKAVIIIIIIIIIIVVLRFPGCFFWVSLSAE